MKVSAANVLPVMLNSNRFLAIFFPLLLTSHSSPGQPAVPTPLPFLPKIEYIGVEDGLPHRDMSVIVQDKQGFFWLSSGTGVYRYDGYQFISLREVAKNGRLLPPALTRIFVQPDGRLLLLVNQVQFFRFDPVANEVSVHPIHRLKNLKLLSAYTRIWMEDSNAFLFQLQENGQHYLLRYTESGGLSKLDSVPHLATNIGTLSKDTAGNLFWGTLEAGIRRYPPNGALVDSLQLPFTNAQIASGFSNECFPDASGRLLVKDFNNKTLVEWDWKHHRILPTGLDIYQVYPYVLAGHEGSSWVLDGWTLRVLDSQNRLHDLTAFLREKADFEIFSGMMQDDRQQLWVTSDNGIFRLGAPGSQFVRYLSAPQPKWAKTTRGFFEDKNGGVHFRCENCGAEAGNTIYRINENTGEAEPVPFSTNDYPHEGLFAWVKSFYKMPGQEVVWTIGKHGLIQLDLAKRSAHLHPAVDAALVDNLTAQIGWCVTRKGEIVAGGKFSQLFAFDPATEKWRFLFPKGIKNEQEGNVKVILEASDGILWVGLNRGLFQVDPVKGKILQRYDSETHTAFLSQEIQALYEDDDGTMWVGTFGGGLVHVFPKTGEADHFTVADGLPNNIIAAILPYADDYLWVSTFNGLTCFHKKEKRFVNFYEEDGLSHNEFNVASAFIDSKGRYYFGGMNGINVFYPREILQPRRASLPLLLTGFSFYDERKDTLAEQFGGLQTLKEVTFSPHVSWFQFNYALPDFVNPKLNQFKTWLEGFEKDWTYQGTNSFIRYNRLPAGHYTLHIQAADSKGYWSENELAIRLTVRQVFYKTWWFVLLLCFAAGAGIFALVRFRYRQKLALERMRTSIAGDLHDEVGSSLSHLNFLVGSFDLENAPEQTAKGIEKSKEIMQKTASDIRDVVWAIDARRDKTGDLLDRMEDFAFDMFSAKNIACHFSTYGIEREAALNPFVRQNIYLIFKEAVNNIAKHSNASEVHISLSQKSDMLEMVVADNGKAVNSSKVKGQGIENMALRAKRIGGKVEIGQGEEGFVVRLLVV